MQAPDRTWRTDGPVRIAVDEAGAGDAVLFLHGIGGNRRNWAGQIAALAPRARALALDFRGYGESDDGPLPRAFADFTDDALAVLDAAGIAAAHVVGLSMGGLVAQALYARAPGRVASLVLAGCRPGSAPVPPGEGFADRRLGPLEDGGSTADLAEALLPGLLGPAVAPGARARIRDSLLALRPGPYRATLAARTAMAPVLDPATIAVPTLVLAGGADRVAPPEQMRALAGTIPGALYAEIPAAGHLMNIEKPALFDALLADFLDGLAPARAAQGTG